MIMDETLEFCDATDISAAAGTALVGDVIDLQVARDLGQFSDLYLVVQYTTAVASAGAATVNIQLASDAAAAIATDGSATVHLQTGAVGKATLVAGQTYVYRLPLEGNTYERYLGILAVTGTATTTAGAINAFLTHDANGQWKAVANAVN